MEKGWGCVGFNPSFEIHDGELNLYPSEIASFNPSFEIQTKKDEYGNRHDEPKVSILPLRF